MPIVLFLSSAIVLAIILKYPNTCARYTEPLQLDHPAKKRCKRVPKISTADGILASLFMSLLHDNTFRIVKRLIKSLAGLDTYPLGKRA